MAAAAAATRGQRKVPSPGRLGTKRAKPVPKQAAVMTIDARGRMYASTTLGRKTVGSAAAVTTGNQFPMRSETGLRALSVTGVCSMGGRYISCTVPLAPDLSVRGGAGPTESQS